MRKLILTLAVGWLLLVLAHPMLAQDATEPAPVVEVTAVPSSDGNDITINMPAPVVSDPAPPVDTGSLAQFGLYLLLAIAGGGSFAMVLNRLDTRGKDALEKAYLSTPPNVQAAILEVLKVATAALKVATEVTDGLANDVPTFMAQAAPPGPAIDVTIKGEMTHTADAGPDAPYRRPEAGNG